MFGLGKGNNFRSTGGSWDQVYQDIWNAIRRLEASSGGGTINPGNAVGDTTYWDGTEWQPTDNVEVFPDDHIQHTFTDGSKTYRYYGGLDTGNYYIKSEILNNYAHLLSSTTTGNRRIELIYDDANTVRLVYDDYHDIGNGGVQSIFSMNNELSALVYADTVTSVTGNPSVSRIIDFYEGSGIGQQIISMATDGLNNTYNHLMFDMLGLFISQSHLYSVDATNSYFYDYIYDSTGTVLQFSRNVGVDQVTGYVTDMYSVVDNTANTRIAESRYFDGSVDSAIDITLFDQTGISRYQHNARTTVSGSEDYISTTNLNRSIERKTNTYNVFGKDSRIWEYGVSKSLVDATVTGDTLVTICDSSDNGVTVSSGSNYALEIMVAGVNLTTTNFETIVFNFLGIIEWETAGGAPSFVTINIYTQLSHLGALPIPDVAMIVTGNNIEIQANCGIGNATDTYRYTVNVKLTNLTNV